MSCSYGMNRSTSSLYSLAALAAVSAFALVLARHRPVSLSTYTSTPTPVASRVSAASELAAMYASFLPGSKDTAMPVALHHVPVAATASATTSGCVASYRESSAKYSCCERTLCPLSASSSFLLASTLLSVYTSSASMARLNRNGDAGLPCGTPILITNLSPYTLPTRTTASPALR